MRLNELPANELARTLLEMGELGRKDRSKLSEVNERYYNSDQSTMLNPVSGDFLNVWNGSGLWPTQFNLIKVAASALTARLVKGRPSIAAYPATAEAKDIISSGIAQHIIEQKELRDGFDTKIADMVRDGLIGGTSGFKIHYDTDKQEVVWSNLSFFDFVLDPQEEYQWVIFKKYLAFEEAEMILEERGIDHTDMETTTYRVNSMSVESEGVEILELWHLPNVRFPEGLFVQTVGGITLETSAYPEAYTMNHPETDLIIPFLPLVLFRPFDVRGSPYGSTTCDDAILPQTYYNQLESIMHKREQMMAHERLLAPASVINQIKNGFSQYITINDESEISKTKFLMTDAVPPLLVQNREYYPKMIFDLFGVSQLAAGMFQLKQNIPAKGLAYLTEIDSDKFSSTIKSLQNALLNGWRYTLALMQKLYATERIARIAGSSDLEAIVWKGASLVGVDVRLEDRSGEERFSQTKALRAEEKAAQGLLDPQEAAERSETGLETTVFEGSQKKIVHTDLSVVLEGREPDLSADPNFAINYLSYLLNLDMSEQERQAIQQMLQHYQGVLQSAQQQEQMQEPTEEDLMQAMGQ